MFIPCEIDEGWQAYFTELDPQERLKLFNALAEQGDEDLELCRILYQERYSDPKYPDRKVDTWLWKFVYLPGLYRRRKFLRSALKKEMHSTLQELHLEHPEALSEMEQTILYLEFRNAARRYLSTCQGDRYGAKMLGMKKATDQEKREKACEDIWIVSRGLALEAGLEENLRLWCDALYDELLQFDPASRKHYAKLEENLKK